MPRRASSLPSFLADAAVCSAAPPLKLFGIPARYANATYTAASKAKCLDQVETELLGFQSLLASKPNFAGYLANPTISRQAKVDAIGKMFEGPKTSSVVKNLMTTIAANGRFADASKVTDAYVELMKAKRGELDAVVTTASALSAAQLKSVTATLKKQAGGKAVSITTKVGLRLVASLWH